MSIFSLLDNTKNLSFYSSYHNYAAPIASCSSSSNESEAATATAAGEKQQDESEHDLDVNSVSFVKLAIFSAKTGRSWFFITAPRGIEKTYSVESLGRFL